MKTKTHLVIPQAILKPVDQIAGKRGRSHFIAQATQEKFERERFLRTLEETKGAWSDKSRPGFNTRRDMKRSRGREGAHTEGRPECRTR